MFGINIAHVLLQFSITLGFSYLIWIFAVKENNPYKTIGQIVALAILILAILAITIPGRPHGMPPCDRQMGQPQVMRGPQVTHGNKGLPQPEFPAEKRNLNQNDQGPQVPSADN